MVSKPKEQRKTPIGVTTGCVSLLLTYPKTKVQNSMKMLNISQNKKAISSYKKIVETLALKAYTGHD